MSLFNINPDEYITQKEPSQHPWDSRIKTTHSETYKYGHNSVINPVYPPKEEKIPLNSQVKFTVIGNRVTKEFIYCLYLVKGLHKYRELEFDTPTIQGLTGVEWPKIWQDLKIKFGGPAHCLRSQVAVLKDGKLLGGDIELKEYVESKYDYYICLNYCKEGILQFHNFISSSGRPCAYFLVSIGEKPIGCLIFMLYADIVPDTCANFLRLCDSKGGYAGSPVHRVVKDCWIQCGGYKLVNNPELECENFIVSHDRRGVLCMANNGRHVDCSTQFFVLLQPASWMAHKYVAFGQLIEGESTLNKIENVPTWYQSPTVEITIYKAGVFNMDCRYMSINKNTSAYVDRHIEDLYALGEMLYEALLVNVFKKAEIRAKERQALNDMISAQAEETEEVTHDLHVTERFEMSKKEIASTLAKLNVDESQKKSHSAATTENKDFDVDEYEDINEYEFEAYSYKQATPSLIVKPEKPYYLPFTDVPYPDEVDSTFNIKKRLKGDYCLENDLDPAPSKKKQVKRGIMSFPQDLLTALFETFNEDEESSDSESSLDSDDEEIKNYIKENTDTTSFAGPVIKKMAHTHDKYEVFNEDNKREHFKKKSLLTDEELRIFRLTEKEFKSARVSEKQVSINLSSLNLNPNKIKRRQTGLIRPEDLDKILKAASDLILSDDDDTGSDDIDRKVHIALKTAADNKSMIKKRPSEAPRQSVLVRLLNDVMQSSSEDDGPTFKDTHTLDPEKTYLILTSSPNTELKGSREKYFLVSSPTGSTQRVLNLQHGKRVCRKISTDYVQCIDTIEGKVEQSVGTLEFKRRRPTMTVSEYQAKNLSFPEHLKESQSKMSKTCTTSVISNKANSVTQTK